MKIKELRESEGMTQQHLAVALGVARSTVAMWERGAIMPSAAKLPEIADVLHCAIDDLYGRIPPREDSAAS